MFSPVEVSFLFPEIDHNRSPAGVALGDMRGDHVGHRPTAG
jgi:hypothetical protein